MSVKAPAPSRSSFKLTITLGLVSFQLAAYSLAEERKVTRKQFSPEGNPVGNLTVDKVTLKPVIREQIVMKYETADGVLVPLTDAEIMKAGGYDDLTGTEVVGVLDVSFLKDRFVPEEFYAVRPADKSQSRVLALILEALSYEGLAILFRFVVRGRERLAMLTHQGVMTVFRFDDEVREQPKPATKPDLKPGEVDLALKLLDAYRVSQVTLPAQTTTVPDQVEKFAAAKAAGMPELIPEAAPSVPLGDLMAQLTASVKAKTKASV